MYHADKGKTTFELYEEERRDSQSNITADIVPPHMLQKIEQARRQDALTRVASVLGALAKQQDDERRSEAMIAEGGPVDTEEEGETI
ncbi:MAG TPA: hypothetical protein PKV96_03800 [Candidatus Saccharimonas sp.]|jgi:hypothetical protein|nr:hypothetical protein [Candidatus Saccharimonas sp.]